MHNKRRISTLILVLGFCLAPSWLAAASVSNLEREKNWADQVVDFMVVGEAVWLEANKVQFLSLYTKPADAQRASTTGVILMHGRGVHPAWGLIDTLRVDLADAGWHTLSLQMPILDPDVKLKEYSKTFPEAFRRIDAGIRYLQQQGVTKIFLLGHSTGAMYSVAYPAEHPKAPIAGAIAIGLSTEPAGNKYMQPTAMLGKIRIPVLDIFGTEDIPGVLDYAAARRAAARNNKFYRQVRTKDADHFFTDHYDILKIRIIDWLKRTQSR